MNMKLAKLFALEMDLEELKEKGKKIPPKKVLRLIELEKNLGFKKLTKYTDWIPLTPAEKMAEDAKQEPSISSEQLQNMKDIFNIEVDAVDDTAPKYHE